MKLGEIARKINSTLEKYPELADEELTDVRCDKIYGVVENILFESRSANGTSHGSINYKNIIEDENE